MKKLLSLVIALACVFGTFTLCTGASAADEMALQDISYDEFVGRIDQPDAGFTRASTYIYSSRINETTEIPSDYGFQFYFIDLGRFSDNRDGANGGEELDEPFLNYIYGRLEKLRNNGGSCMIRACYASDGQFNAEPSDFNLLLTHQAQLAAIFSKFSDIITTVECGMIGAFGEMHSGLYSDWDHKRQVLHGWLTNLPKEITVCVRTLSEYTNYVNFSDFYKTNYRKKTVNGITYPATFAVGNFYKYSFPAGTPFERIGIYNDAMIQDFNDGGTFGAVNRATFVEWLSKQTQVAVYGGEFSGASGRNGYDFRLYETWLPMNAIPEFYKTHLNYYHGGNRAYVHTGCFKGECVSTRKYDNKDEAAVKSAEILENFEKYALGMDVKAELQDDGVTMKYTTGGWSTATVSGQLFDEIKKTVNSICDFSAYNGKKVSSFFEDHLGHRIVLKESYLNTSVDRGGVLTVKGKIDNTGFSNLRKGRIVEIVLTNGKKEYTVKTSNINPDKWKSATRSDYIADIKLPSDIESGEWKVYMRVTSPYTDPETNEKVTNKYNCIKFANAGDFNYKVLGTGAYDNSSYNASIIYNSDICGNYLGKFNVTENTVEGSDTSIKEVYVSTPLSSVTIPDGVTSISDSAFIGCTSLTSVTIPDSVTSIGNDAFNGCTSLSGVTIPGSVTSIGNWAFCNCTSLSGVTIPDSVTGIGNYAFRDCTSLASITIPDSVTNIGESAFSDCTSLASITIPDSVTSIGQNAFYLCYNLTIKGYNGSYAQTYANENNIPFVDVRCDENIHVYGDWVIDREASCAETGLKRRECEACHKVESAEIAALGHDYDTEWTVDVEPAAGVPGSKSHHCKRCGDKKDITEIPATGTENVTDSYIDVVPGEWYVSAVQYAVDNGLFFGVSDNEFAPDEAMNRAMLVTVLWRLEGRPAVSAENTFNDVPAGKWYTDAVIWASENGVVYGTGEKEFSPEDNITREQMAAILYRYAKKKGYDVTASTDLATFPDSSDASSYARDALSWACGAGLIFGSDGKLLPQYGATRAQVAAILMRYTQKVVQK